MSISCIEAAIRTSLASFGATLWTPLGLSWKDMQRIPTVMGVASGIEKTSAILGALRTKLLHVLILDDQTAFKIIESIEPP